MKKLILSVLVAGVMLAGGNVAYAQKASEKKAKKEQMKQERKVQKHGDKLERLKTELGLREDQVPQVKQAIAEHREAIKKIREENTDKQVAKEKRKAANLAFQTKMKSILNEAQYRKYEQMMAERKKAMKGKHKGQKKQK